MGKAFCGRAPNGRAGLPLFFGVIVGDITLGAFWALLGLVFDIPVYSVWSR